MTAPTNPTPDPDPTTTAGVDSQGIQPGETPPDSGSMSGASGDAHKAPNMGPVSGNRTPMIIALSVLAVFVVMVAILGGASFFPSD